MNRIQNKGKERLLCFAPEDADAFSATLRERWPTISFIKYQYWDYQPGRHYAKENWKDIPEYSSLGDPSENMFQVWVKPKGWRARWSRQPNKNGIYVIENEPKLCFIYQSSVFTDRDHFPRPENGEKLCLSGRRISEVYDKDDKEHEQFLNAVWRIAAKLSTNIVDVLDMHTGEVKYPAQRTVLWCGYHALDWCRQHPDRRLDDNIRPID